VTRPTSLSPSSDQGDKLVTQLWISVWLKCKKKIAYVADNPVTLLLWAGRQVCCLVTSGPSHIWYCATCGGVGVLTVLFYDWASFKTWHAVRVTRLGEFSPIEWLLPNGIVYENSERAKVFALLFPVAIRVTRWVCYKIAQNVAQPVFVKINIQLLPWIKVAQNFVQLLYFSKNYSKKTITQYAKNSPNLVTLVAIVMPSLTKNSYIL
jgi:hypothetical protein